MKKQILTSILCLVLLFAVLGAGVWGGFQRYTVYSCPVCGMTEESGEKTFILPNDLALSFSYVF